MTGNLLAIETALNRCSVALVCDGKLIGFAEHAKQRAHAEQLAPMTKELLDDNRISPTQLGGVCVSGGPGSYTGLRIGVSTAKGICFATGSLLIPVPTLQAIALRAYRKWTLQAGEPDESTHTRTEDQLGMSPRTSTREESTWVAVAMKARASEIYWAVFAMNHGIPEPVVETCIVESSEAALYLSDSFLSKVVEARSRRGPVPPESTSSSETTTGWSTQKQHRGTSTGPSRILLSGNVADELFQTMASSGKEPNIHLFDGESTDMPLAVSIAELGWQMFVSDQSADLATYEPAYLKEFVAAKAKGSIFDQLRI